MMKWFLILTGMALFSWTSEASMIVFMGVVTFMSLVMFDMNLVFSSLFVIHDYLSSLMILLSATLWLLSLSVLPSKMKSGGFYFLFFSLLIAVVLFFSMSSMLGIFITFEISLIPITLMILGWGNQVERIQASLYLLFYTVFFSLPLFVVILVLLKEGNSTILLPIQMGSNGIVMFILMLSFFVKLPIYLVHLWLPKAHVEAPMIGSMLLAGILLKMGGYGSYRLMMWGGALFSKSFFWFVGLWGFVGGLLGSLACCVQEDLKSLVAMASVGHMNFMLGGLFVNTIFSFGSFMILMFVHGLVSSCLFMGGTWFYERFGSRLLLLVQGLLLLVPWSVMLYSIGILANFAVPPFISFVAEFMLVSASWLFSPWMLVWMGIMIFFACYYSIYFMMTLIHGKWISKGATGQSKIMEWSGMALHLVPCVLLLLIPGLMSFCPLGVFARKIVVLEVLGQ